MKILAILFAALAVSCGGPTPAGPTAVGTSGHALAGKTLPGFQHKAVDGTKIDTQAFGGRPVVVKFFAKYCEPCKRSLPFTEKLHQKYPDVAMIGVAEDDSVSDVNETISTYSLTFPVVHDKGNVLSGRYRVSAMPITFVADKSGTITWIGGPSQTEAELKEAIESAR